MKNFFLLVLLLVIGFGGYIAFKWVAEDDTTIGEQVDIVKEKINESYEDTAVSNTANSASKLGNSLKKRLDEAQGNF